MKDLSDYVRDSRPLDDAQRWQILALIGRGCNRRVKEALERRLKFVHIHENHGVYADLIVHPIVSMAEVEGHNYYDYMATIKEIRKCVLGGVL